MANRFLIALLREPVTVILDEDEPLSSLSAPSSSSIDGQGGDVGAMQASSLSTLPANFAPAVIVIVDDDDDGHGENAAPSPSASGTATPLRYWVERIGCRMAQAEQDVTGFGGRVCWNLPHTLGHNTVEWAIAHINGILDQAYVKAFYVGITHKVGWRWSDPDAGHRRKGWQRMFLLAVSDSSDVISQAEIAVLEEFRFYCRGGYFLGPREVRGRIVRGHRLCVNRLPGGEGGSHGEPPHVLYVCWRWNPRN